MRSWIRLAAISLMLALASVAFAEESIQAFGHRWTVPIGDDWKVTSVDGVEMLELLVPRPSTAPRRPTQFALAQTPDFEKVTIELEVKKEPAEARDRHTSLLIVYAYRDDAHFNYAHLSVDTGEQVAVHNGIFHVYDGDRVRISSTQGPPALTSEEWHKVRLVYDGSNGRVDVEVDGKALPSLRAVDMSLGAGKIGLGSFFDMGEFRNVQISGDPIK